MTPVSDDILLEIGPVTKSFGANPILRDVHLTVRRGEFMTMLGPSGCGKTTTLRIIAGFESPDTGRVRLNGEDVTDQPPYERDVHTVFQHYALFPHLDVGGNIAFGMKMDKVPEAEIRKRIPEALAMVKLEGFENRRVSSLSGGQMQRVALARAIAGRPAILLLDEPLGALDLKLRKDMQLELKRLQKKLGFAFVYVTHDQEEAMTMSDRIAVMSHGSVVQIGTPQEIYERPATLFVADFIGLSNILTGEVLDRVGSVRLAGGTVVRVPAGAAARVGSKVAVVVRPDHMSLSPSPPGGDANAIRGRITKLSFLGTHLQISVAIEAHVEIVVSRPLAPEEQGDPLPERGDQVLVTWAVARSFCFPDTERLQSEAGTPAA